jgi:hypothetical protein
MGRHIESPELFGVGAGHGTAGDITCGICGTEYNQGADEAEDYHARDTVQHTDFAGITVCECCFEAVEREVELRMPAVLRWYRAIVEHRRATLARDVKLLDEIGMERQQPGAPSSCSF